MNFNSFDYLCFLTLLYLFYRLYFGEKKSRRCYLLVASFIFYAWWSPIHVFLLLYSGFSDYYIAKYLHLNEDKKKRKFYLTLSISNNLLLLFTFKYLCAFIENINIALEHTPMIFRIVTPELILPIGISFYTFQTMSYAFDVYRKHIPPLESKIDFLLYVSFFPQLVAGPILRAKQFIPQLLGEFTFSKKMFFTGVFFIFYGLLKKNCIADPLGVYFVDPVFLDPNNHTSYEILVSLYAYGFQVFNDFSGYSDIAIGSALLFGFSIPINFDSPFITTNPADFWNRWHISLTHWVRDYVFYPFNSNKIFKGRIRLNMFVTMVIIGVWHGARWTYLFFGIFHGLLSILHSLYGKKLPSFKGKKAIIWKFFTWFCFWHFLCIGFLLFRADSMKHVWFITEAFVNNINLESKWDFPLMSSSITIILALLTHFIRAKKLENLGHHFANLNNIVKIILCWIFFMLFMHYEYLHQGKQAFIYFQF